ncbi:MAG TPA: prepilin-type N-terminal cleavage/methylation domain-containing protein, partial [Pirellulaceae bacterium]|nr:prepilin-type N-terminal cleavage/methylation domain-containing protein [Pirellulaceae bacterium]
MPRPRQHFGFTMIELLVTISILVILAVITIPTVRFLSKGRQTLESANYLGSALVAAKSRAMSDGLAGVVIVRNPNFKNGNGGHRVYQVRAPLPFSGYGSGSIAIVDIANRQASLPVVYDPALLNINDYVQFNKRGAVYRVTNVQVDPSDPARTLLDFFVRPIDPPLPDPTGTGITSMTFTVFRRPVPIPSTIVELPRGFMVDLEFSGHGARGDQFFLNPPPTLADLTNPALDFNVIILFNEKGGVEHVFRSGWGSA